MSLNVCGLVNKLKCPLFSNDCLNYDVICFTETKTNDHDKLLLETFFRGIGYKGIVNNRVQKSTCNRKSGGIVVAIKDLIAKHIQVLKTTEVATWLEFSCVLTGSDKNIIVANIYIPPRQSRYSDIEMFTKLENDMYLFGLDENYFVLCGDFNAHTGTRTDVMVLDKDVCDITGIDEDMQNSMDIAPILEKCNIPFTRNSVDKNKDRLYGDRLLELCKNNGMIIFNGRAGNDCMVGKSTTKHGTVVDYIIGSPFVLSHIDEFDIDDFDPLLSLQNVIQT